MIPYLTTAITAAEAVCSACDYYKRLKSFKSDENEDARKKSNIQKTRIHKKQQFGKKTVLSKKKSRENDFYGRFRRM